MKFTYLGTAASEGFPALFCNCEYCREARRLGGKNLRTRSQALINDDLLIDLPADTNFHVIRNGLELDKVKFLLFTHSHSDHLNPQELRLRGDAYAHDMRSDILEVYCGQGVQKEYDRINGGKISESIASKIRFQVIKAFETFRAGEYTITPLPARHKPNEDAFFYAISDGEKNVLYAHDTGYFFEEVFDWIGKNKTKFDLVSLDCTNVDIPIADNGNHMGFPNAGRVLERLRTLGAVTDRTQCFVNHFSHNGNPLQELLEKKAEPYGCRVAYDGLQIDV